MSDEKQVWEVWTFAGHGSPELVSDDPVEIVHWLRAQINEDEYAGYNVHPLGRGFHTHALIQHDFISRYKMQTAEDIIQKAFEAGNTEGLAQELHDLYFGRVARNRKQRSW